MGNQHHPKRTCAAAPRVAEYVLHSFITRISLPAMAGLILCAGIAMCHAAARSRIPQFSIRNPIARPDSGIIIVAQNRAAKRGQPLNVEYEGLRMEAAARLLSKENGEFYWHFRPTDLDLPAQLLRDGVYHLRVGLPGQALSEPMRLVWHTQPPVVTAETIKISGSDKVTIAGRVASKVPYAEHQISVELLLNTAHEPISIALPAQRAADSSGVTIFTFRIAIQGLPKILPGEIGFAQPFFALVVADPAHNYVYYEESYAWFTAPGRKRMGLKTATAQNVRQALSTASSRREIDFYPRATGLSVQATHTQQAGAQLPAEKSAVHAHQLQWTVSSSLPARDGPVISLVWRDGQPTAVCFSNQYLDEEARLAGTCNYYVEQIARNGQIAGSTSLRVEAPPSMAQMVDGNQTLLAQAFGPNEVAAAPVKFNLRDQASIAAILVKHKPAIQDCYQRGLRSDYNLKGKVVVRFMVTPQGEVSEAEIVSSTLNNIKVEDCVLNHIKRWNDFGAASPADGEVAFKQTYIFGY